MSLFRNRSVLASSLGHFSVDMYSGMLPLILLIVKSPLGLSYAQVGLLSMAFSLSSSLSQPLFGWIGDRRYSRFLAVAGVAAISVSMGTMRFAGDFLSLLLLATIGGLGAGAFHPQGAVLASRTTLASRGAAMSLYMLGGNAGYAFGPKFSTAVFGLAGNSMPEILATVGLLQALLLYWAIARQQQPAHSQRQARPTAKRAATGIIITLALVIFFRSWVQTSIQTFVPQVYSEKGFDTDYAGQVLFSILMPLAIGGLVGGTLSDRVGRRVILIISTGLVGPALWGLLTSDPSTTFIWGAVLGVAMGASLPVTLVMVQELFPRGLGLMSGVALGFTFIAGAIGASVNGLAADHFGLFQTMMINPVFPILASALAFLLPDDRVPAQVAEEV